MAPALWIASRATAAAPTMPSRPPLLHRAPVLGEDLLEREAVDVFHDDEQAARLVDEVDHPDNVLVALGDAFLDLGFLPEPLTEGVAPAPGSARRVGVDIGEELLDGDVTVEQAVVAFPDNRRPAGADLADDLELVELVAGMEGGGGHALL